MAASEGLGATTRSRGLIVDGVVVAAGALGRALHALSEAPLENWDEGLYCAATQQMRHAGEWLYAVHEGRFDGYYGKPPLINWLQFLSTDALGWAPSSLRLPSALGTAATVVLAWALSVRLAGRAAGAIAAGLLLLSAPFLAEGRHVLLEPLLAAFFLGAILVHDLGTTRGAPSGVAFAIGSGALCAAAILTKQVLGLFPVLAILGSEIVLRRPGFRARVPAFLATVLLLSGWWFVLVHAEVGEAFARSFFERHVVARVEGVVEGHANSPNLYVSRLGAYSRIISPVFGTVGLLGLVRYGRSAFASVALLSLFFGHYVAHALLSKTMLEWYPWPMVPVLSIGVATLITETFRLDRSGVLRWVVPLTIAVSEARVLGAEPLAYGVAIVAVAYVGELALRNTSARFLVPTALLLGALFVSVRTMPASARASTRPLAAIDPSELAVLLDHRHVYLPRCDFPDAQFFYFGRPNACQRAAAALLEANPRKVLAYGRLASCSLGPTYRRVERGGGRALFERVPD